MKTTKKNDKVFYILEEKDIKEALVQYIENWENVQLPEREFNFVGDNLEISCQDNQKPKPKQKKKPKKKLSQKKRIKQNKINKGKTNGTKM